MNHLTRYLTCILLPLAANLAGGCANTDDPQLKVNGEPRYLGYVAFESNLNDWHVSSIRALAKSSIPKRVQDVYLAYLSEAFTLSLKLPNKCYPLRLVAVEKMPLTPFTLKERNEPPALVTPKEYAETWTVSACDRTYRWRLADNGTRVAAELLLDSTAK